MNREMVLKRFSIIVVALVFTANECFPTDEHVPTVQQISASKCSQEMCVFLFDRLEEQSVRLHNIEDALLRTFSILASHKEFSSASAALRSDSLINSLLIPGDYDPEESIVMRMQQMPDVLETPILSREKRQVGEQTMSPKERLTEALKWAKKNSAIRIETIDSKDNGSNTDKLKTEQFFSSQKSQQDSAVPVYTANIISSRSANEIILNNNTQNLQSVSLDIHTLPSTSSSKNVSNHEVLSVATTQTTNQTEFHKYVKDSINDLQGAVKCAMAQLNDANISESIGVFFEPQATLNLNKTLTLQFEVKNCQKYWTAVWIKIFVQNEVTITSGEKKSTQFVLQIPKDCLKKRGNVFGLTLPSIANKACTFPLIELSECKVYTVEITPIYLTLQGRPSSVEFTVPPELLGNSTDLISLQRVALQSSTHMLSLKWSVRSMECAPLMMSVKIRIYEDESDTMLQSFTVPADCLGNEKQNDFSATLSSFGDGCSSVTWKPLEICQKYKLDIEPEYFSALRGKLSSLDIFTPSTEYSTCCNVLNSTTGSIRVPRKDYYNNYYATTMPYYYTSDKNGNSGDIGCNWIIFVEKNSTIWLTFTEFNVQHNSYLVKVYDGSNSTSPLLLQHQGTYPPSPIRSRTNKLFIQLIPQDYGQSNYGNSFTAHYITVCNGKSDEEGHAA